MKLADIDPSALAASLSDAVARYVQRLAFPLSPGLTLSVTGDARSAGIAWTAMQLCQYAQTGALGDWPDASCAVDAAQEIVQVMYDRPVDHVERVATDDGAEATPSWWHRIDGDTALGVVMRAGLARAWAETGLSDVPLVWLAPLCGISEQRLRQLAKAREIATRMGDVGLPKDAHLVPAAEALRFLRARGVVKDRESQENKGV
jgi:hypothetical protein